MKSNELLGAIGDLLDRKKSKRLKHVDKLKTLLEKIEKNRKKLEEQLQVEKSPHKRDRLIRELEVIKVQQAKGLRALKKLS